MKEILAFLIATYFLLLTATPTQSTSCPSEPEIIPETFTATAYSMGEITFSGLPVDKGVVAVDPAVIPLHSIVHLTTEDGKYDGYYYAIDTGGKILGNRVDIYMDKQSAIEFGVQNIKIKMIK